MTFDDRLAALDFAEQAKMNADEPMKVYMEFVDDDEKKEA